MEVVLKHLGYLLLIFSIFPVIPLIAAIIYSEPVLPFLATAILSLLLGFLLISSRDATGKRPSIKFFDIPRSISLSALSFITISVIGTVPYLMILKTSFLDALFESVSGFTTTGLTILTNVEEISRSLLIWRAETQWIGGLGIILLFLIVVSAMRRQQSLKETTTKAKAVATLYHAQGASEKLEASMEKSMRNTVLIYGGYTLFGIFLLFITGLSFFESISTAFTAISTGGFSVTDDFYTAGNVLGVLLFLMIAGSVSWVAHNRFFRGHLKDFIKDLNLRFYLLTIVAAVVIVFLFIGDFKTAIFETVSAITTTGYSITDISALPAVAIMVIVLCMLVGGMLGSTAGGIKINRFLLMLKSLPWMVKKAASPAGAIIPLKAGNMVIEDEDMLITQAFIACYVIILILGTIILMVTGLSFLDSSFQTTSALGVVGLSTASPALFHPVAKTVLIVAMLFGRLEIIPLLILGRYFYEKARTKMRRKKEEARKLFYMKWIPSAVWKRRP
ncbi:hypothetical protein KY349_02375 [Candidatus Woesearchaeota archaeon]|nr:hypothetical protein [Candidatus Woesearchaeota archaeon]